MTPVRACTSASAPINYHIGPGGPGSRVVLDAVDHSYPHSTRARAPNSRGPRTPGPEPGSPCSGDVDPRCAATTSKSTHGPWECGRNVTEVLPGPNPGHPALEMSIQGVPLPHQNPPMGHGNVEGM